jgi:hypothetical protein
MKRMCSGNSKKEHDTMSRPLEPQKKEQPSTYFVQDRQSEQELARLAIQDRLITAGMGGVLSEQSDPTSLQRVLDVGCGTGAVLSKQPEPTQRCRSLA